MRLSVGMMVASLGVVSLLGYHGEAPCSLPRGRGALKVKTLSSYGRATTAPYRCALLGGVVSWESCPSGDPTSGVAGKHTWFVLPRRCRGFMEARRLKPSRKVLCRPEHFTGRVGFGPDREKLGFFRAEKILPMTVPWDVPGLRFRAGLGWATCAFYRVK
jgi:hypothetical protein